MLWKTAGNNGGRLVSDIHTSRNLRSLRVARQALGECLQREVVQVQQDVVHVRAHTAAFTDLNGQVAAHHLLGRQAHGRRSNPSHERFALPVSRNTSFTTATLSE